MESWKENDVAISEDIARKTCGTGSPVGRKLILKKKEIWETYNEYQIVAIFKTRPKHSNFKFNILKKLYFDNSPWINTQCRTFVRLHRDADPKLFLKRLTTDTISLAYGVSSTHNVLIPLKDEHNTIYLYSTKQLNVHLDDAKLFSIAAILLSVCSLVNYLTLFISRLRNRGRDMALRSICGSSSRQMGIMLLIEYLLLLIGALFLSIIFIELIYHDFVELAQIEINRSTVYLGCGYLLFFILSLATLLSLVPILYFKQKNLRSQLNKATVQPSKNSFRFEGVGVQLFISILFIFCASVMIKQMHYLIYADINIERKNIASLLVADIKKDQIMDVLRQLPMITEMIPANNPLYPYFEVGEWTLSGFEGKEDLIIHARLFDIDSDIALFYGLKMKEGAEKFNLRHGEYLINETLAEQLGDPNPVGKTFNEGLSVIKGVIYDFAYQPPTEPVRAVIFRESNPNTNNIAFKYSGDFVDCKTAIEKAFEGEFISLRDGETVYKDYVRSELNLLKLLNVITFISLLIALFGVYALILQECERQRKNIAIRKVYGAQVKDILMMFFKRYMMQVVIAAAFAFPIGYVLMKHWLEGYSRQISIGIEIFLGIFVGIALLVTICIGWRVWRAANENPATAVKKE